MPIESAVGSAAGVGAADGRTELGVGAAAGLSGVFGITDVESAPGPSGVGAAAGVATVIGYGSDSGVGAAAGVGSATGVGSLTSTTGVGSSAGAATVSGAAQLFVEQVSENPKTYLLRVREVRIGANGIAEFDLVREDLSIYSSIGQSPILGSDLAGGGPSPPGDNGSDSDASRPGSTRLVMLDIPQLLAEHTGPGFYAAASGVSSGWTGAILYRKDGQEYTEIARLGDRAVIGRADTELPDGDVTLFAVTGRTYVWDETSTVDVTLIESVSALASVSDDDVLAGSNIAAIGQHGRWEIIGFGTVTQLAERRYRLSHLLRGLKGTEWATATHQAGDSFVKLDAALRRVTDEFSALNVERTFRVVSIGNTFASASDRKFTNTGVSLEPLSPVFIRGEADAEDNRLIRWWGRSRYDGLAGRDDSTAPPADETVERYEVDFYNGAFTTVVRTVTALGEVVGYSAAQQTLDHGSVPSSLNGKIYKISANPTVGRGYAGTFTISSFAAVDTTSPGLGVAIYDIYISPPGPQRNRRITVPLLRTLLFRAGMGGSWARSSATSPVPRPVATAESEYSLQKNGVEFATVTFDAGADMGVVESAADVVFYPGLDTLELVEPGTADATLRDVGFGFAGERI